MRYNLLFLLLLGSSVSAQDVIYANSKTINWPAVTELVNGDPVPATATLQYEFFSAPVPVVNRQDAESLDRLGVVSDTTITINVTWSEQRALGGRTIMTMPDSTVLYSVVAWSDEQGGLAVNPFVLVRVQNPKAPAGATFVE